MTSILDCTFRDGGYYNDWRFPRDVIQHYLEAMSELEIDFVELGFRCFRNTKSEFGYCAYTSDAFLATLEIPENLKLGVMVNLSDLIAWSKIGICPIERYFKRSGLSCISFVRIAAHMNEIDQCGPFIEKLQSFGYSVALNLMQIAARSDQEIERFIKLCDQFELMATYFADSTGSLDRAEISKLVDTVESFKPSNPIGLHLHNNFNNAVDNAVFSTELGLDFVDVTVTGMGRGPGNPATEEFILRYKGATALDKLLPLLTLIEVFFENAKRLYKWGYHPLYHYSGLKKIHPSYVQELLENSSRFDTISMVQALRALGDDVSAYESGWFSSNLSSHYYSKEPDLNISGLSRGQSVLIIGNGDTLSDNVDAIRQFKRIHDCFVIVLNDNNVWSFEDSDVIVTSNFTRFHRLQKFLADHVNKITVITPFQRPAQSDWQTFCLDIEPGTFSVQSKKCILPNDLSVSYGLAIAKYVGASKVFFAGIGSSGSDRLLDIQKSIELASADLEIISLTATALDMPEQSLYEI